MSECVHCSLVKILRMAARVITWRYWTLSTDGRKLWASRVERSLPISGFFIGARLIWYVVSCHSLSVLVMFVIHFYINLKSTLSVDSNIIAVTDILHVSFASLNLGNILNWGPFLESPENFGRISADIILFVSSKRRRFEAQHFAVILIFIPLTTYEKTSFTEWAGRSVTNGFSGLSRNGSLESFCHTVALFSQFSADEWRISTKISIREWFTTNHLIYYTSTAHSKK